MRKIILAVGAVWMGLMLLSACGAKRPPAYSSGVYRAEFEGFDSYGYKDYLEVTVEDGAITAVVFNGVDEEGGLKTADEKYATDMQAVVQHTYPEKYTGDLVNQLLEKQDIAQVDVLAGATYSSESFTTLFTALESNMAAGNEQLVTVPNITPQK